MATYRVVVLARTSFRQPAALQQHEAAISDLADRVSAALGPRVAAAAWLKERFPAGCVVHVQVRPHPGDEPVIEKPRSKSRGGPREILCPVGIPVGWFGGGTPALRFEEAVLQALAVVGENFGPGPPPLRRPVTRRKPSAGAGADLARRLAAAGPGQLLLAAPGPDGERRAEILKALGVDGPGAVVGDIRVWTVRGLPQATPQRESEPDGHAADRALANLSPGEMLLLARPDDDNGDTIDDHLEERLAAPGIAETAHSDAGPGLIAWVLAPLDG